MTKVKRVRMRVVGVKVREVSKGQIIFGLYFPWERSSWRMLSGAMMYDLHF